MKIAYWVIIGLVVVAILTHAPGFATAVTALGGQSQGLGAEISGQGIAQGSHGTVSSGTPGSTGYYSTTG